MRRKLIFLVGVLILALNASAQESTTTVERAKEIPTYSHSVGLEALGVGGLGSAVYEYYLPIGNRWLALESGLGYGFKTKYTNLGGDHRANYNMNMYSAHIGMRYLPGAKRHRCDLGGTVCPYYATEQLSSPASEIKGNAFGALLVLNLGYRYINEAWRFYLAPGLLYAPLA